MDENTDPVRPDHQLRSLPNASIVIISGILSIVSFGISLSLSLGSVIFGIIGLVFAEKDLEVYNDAPNTYASGSFRKLNLGRLCAIIGLAIGGAFFLNSFVRGWYPHSFFFP